MAALLRARCFLLLAAFLPIMPAGAEVVDSVSDCSEFLLGESPPNIPEVLESGIIQNQTRYKPICQTFRNTRRFLTVYDTEDKIPVFSAYKFKKITTTGRQKPHWMKEPQLEDRNTSNSRGGRNMISASYDEYVNVPGYDKGYLYPNSHAPGRDDRISTFTLTNVVPQAKTFKSGSWQRMRNCLQCVMETLCINSNRVPEGFVVTGAQSSVDDKLNHKVVVPSMLWSAFCCYSSTKKKWLAGAHWGDNTNGSPGKYLQTKTVEELNEKLSTVDSRFDVFPGKENCLNATVAEFYPELDRKCPCPRRAPTTSTPESTTTQPQGYRMFRNTFKCSSKISEKCFKKCEKMFKICRKNDQCQRRAVHKCAQMCHCQRRPVSCRRRVITQKNGKRVQVHVMGTFPDD